ncbi:hypothetical protein ACHAW6_006016 [Cyclotella cf. meneghiniana]
MSIKLGPERILQFHTTDPADLGLTLTHTPTTIAMGISTGYVRITSVSSDGGMVEGDARLNDVVVEAAGVNMRRPISDGMWRLTLGLMEVAPRPLEVVVAAEVDEDASPEQDGRDELSNQITGMEDEKQVGYYQLVTPNKYSVVNDPVLSAKLYHLEDSCDFSHRSPVEAVASPDRADSPDSSLDQSPIVVRNPFLDPNRFGPERTIVFRTESLGVKLHRSASEGVVHVLHVTSYEPPKGSTMLPPRDGDLEEGDAIMEVGGVDLRNQCIGRVEWADMVHFIKYVGRPLEMVVARDSLYTPERVGVVAPIDSLKEEVTNAAVCETDVCSVARESLDIREDKDEVDNVETQVLDAEKDNEDDENPDERVPPQNPLENNAIEWAVAKDEGNMPSEASEIIITETLQDLSGNRQSVANDNNYNAVTGGICSTSGLAVAAKAGMDGYCATPDAAADTASGEERGEQNNSPNVQKVMLPDLVNDHLWMKTPDNHSELVETKSTKSSPARTPKTIFHRTHPTAENTSIIELSSEARGTTNHSESFQHEIETTWEIPVSPGAKSTAEEFSVISPERKSVAELRGLFSPIKLPDTAKRLPIVPFVENCEFTNATGNNEVNPVSGFKDRRAAPDAASHMADGRNEYADEVGYADETRAEKSLVTTKVPNANSPAREKKNSALHNLTMTDTDNAVVLTTHALDDVLIKTLEAEECNHTSAISDISPDLAADMKSTIDPDIIPDAPSVDPDSQSHNEEDKETQKPASRVDVNVTSSSNHFHLAASDPTPDDNIKDSYADELGPTPEKPFDETANSSLHEQLVNDLAGEFRSPTEKSVLSSDSRDDTEQKKHREIGAKKDGKRLDITTCSKPVTSALRFFPTPASTRTAFCGGLFVIDDTDSPFCGNIKFSSNFSDKVPASASFSQAFVVQKTGSEEQKAPPVTDHIRWESTNSPLFVTKKSVPDAGHKTKMVRSSYPPAERTPPERLFPDPLVKGFDRIAFDMAQLDVSAVSLDDGSLSDDPSYNPNDTIVYADESAAQADCCGFDSFCADNMFEGLVSNCGVDPTTQRQTKEKSTKRPSPRRKTLLSLLRKGNKKNKEKVAYGNLDDDEKESMKGIKKAHIQLRKQNVYGLSVESASQYAPMSDLIEI